MRKEIIANAAAIATLHHWLDLERVAVVQVSSDSQTHPVENALKEGTATGWRAAASGAQSLKLVFDAPQDISRILLEFEDAELERTQELSLAWSDATGARHEIVRQRWNFSPRGSTAEKEDYRVDLRGVHMLDLTIDPDVSGSSEAVATLLRLRIG